MKMHVAISVIFSKIKFYEGTLRFMKEPLIYFLSIFLYFSNFLQLVKGLVYNH